ncbi:MAG: hypothetical protein ACRD24_07125 [Terriglobales bacterium]
MRNLVTFSLLVVMLASVAEAQTSKPSASHPAFEQLKKLEGVWEVDFGQKATVPAEAVMVRFDLIARGSVLRETNGAGTPDEMITLYHLDGDTVVSAHYCAGGNQSTVRAKNATAKEIVFPEASVTNLAPGASYMRLERVEFLAPDSVRFVWSSVNAKGERLGAYDMTYHRKK